MQPLMEAGLDSLGAVELRASLEAAFAQEMPATVTFDYPSIAALANFIAGRQATPQVLVLVCLPTALLLVSFFFMMHWVLRRNCGAGCNQKE